MARINAKASAWRQRNLWSRLGALAHPGYRRLQFGNVLSNVGNFFEQVAQSWLIYQMTGSAAWVGLHALASNGPTLLMALPAGALADRFNRRKLLLLILSVWTALAALIAILCAMKRLNPITILVISALEGFCASAQRPVLGALVLDIAGRKLLPSAIAYNSALFNIARLLGPSLGGMVLAHWGAAPALALNALSFGLVIRAAAMLRIPHAAERPIGSFARQLFDGVAYGWRHRGYRWLWWSSAVFCLLSGPVQGLLVVFAREALHGGAREYGYMLSAMAMGAMGGAWASSRATRVVPRSRWIPLAAGLYGAFGILLALTRQFPLAFGVMILIGVCHTGFLVSSMTAIQLLAPNAMRGRLGERSGACHSWVHAHWQFSERIRGGAFRRAPRPDGQYDPHADFRNLDAPPPLPLD